MGREWENSSYGHVRRRRWAQALLGLTLAASVVVFWLLRPGVKKSAAVPALLLPSRPQTHVSRPEAPLSSMANEEIGVAAELELPLPNATRTGDRANADWQAAEGLLLAGKYPEALAAYKRLARTNPFSRGRAGFCLARMGHWDEAVSELQAAVSAQPNDFAVRKLLAYALYRQNELKAALEQVQAALAMLADNELLDLQAKLEKEIRVQRHYDDARTANFVVLFDGYEHDEIKRAVLDILKDAYADIGKELDYFPEQPMSVILYTAKDFSDVTRAPMWASGEFGKIDGKIRLPVQGSAYHERELRRVLYHEYTHALLYQLAPGCPLWLQEGLAQYLCGDRPVSAGQMIPLPLLVNGFPAEPRAAYAAYMESLQAVSDLLEEHGMARLHLLLGKLSDGSDLETAFATAYGQPFSRWAKSWRPLQRQK